MEIPFMILGALISLLIFYLIIERVVRDGINNSSIGQLLEERHGIKEPQEDEDLFDEKYWMDINHYLQLKYGTIN
jgi:hypothetical protein